MRKKTTETGAFVGVFLCGGVVRVFPKERPILVASDDTCSFTDFTFHRVVPWTNSILVRRVTRTAMVVRILNYWSTTYSPATNVEERHSKASALHRTLVAIDTTAMEQLQPECTDTEALMSALNQHRELENYLMKKCIPFLENSKCDGKSVKFSLKKNCFYFRASDSRKGRPSLAGTSGESSEPYRIPRAAGTGKGKARQSPEKVWFLVAIIGKRDINTDFCLQCEWCAVSNNDEDGHRGGWGCLESVQKPCHRKNGRRSRRNNGQVLRTVARIRRIFSRHLQRLHAAAEIVGARVCHFDPGGIDQLCGL